MARAYTRGAKLRAKKSGLPDLAEVPKKKARGRKRMDQIKRDPDAERTVLQARARQSGKSPKDITDMRATAYGEPAGMAIYAIHGGDAAKRLWDNYTALSGAYKRYLSICIGTSIDAKTAKIEMMPERFEASASDTPDMRSDDERHRAAANAWHGWRAALNDLPLGHSAAIYAALHGWGDLMDGGQITAQGMRFVEAMEYVDLTAGTR